MFGLISRTEVSVLVLVMAIFSFFIVGSVPYSTLAEHTFAYVAMAVFVAQFATLAFIAFVEYVLVPVADRLWAWRNARAEARCTGECGRQHF